MSIAVLERLSFKDESLVKAFPVLQEIKSLAVDSPGYLKSNSLLSKDHPGELLVIYEWRDLVAATDWERNPDRRAAMLKLTGMLRQPAEKESCFPGLCSLE